MPLIIPQAPATGKHFSDSFNRTNTSTLGASWTNRASNGTNQLIIYGNQAGNKTLDLQAIRNLDLYFPGGHGTGECDIYEVTLY